MRTKDEIIKVFDDSTTTVRERRIFLEVAVDVRNLISHIHNRLSDIDDTLKDMR